MKNHTFIYCGEDGNAGRELGNQIRDKDSDNKVRLLSCEFFGGPEPDAEHVIIMTDVPDHIGSVICEAYPKNIVEWVAKKRKPPPPAVYEMPERTPFPQGQIIEQPDPPAKRKPGRPRKVAA